MIVKNIQFDNIGKLVRDEKGNSDPNFVIQTTKMERSPSSVYRLRNRSHFFLSIFSDIKTKMRQNVLSFVMSEFHEECYSLEPLTEAGEAATTENNRDKIKKINTDKAAEYRQHNKNLSY